MVRSNLVNAVDVALATDVTGTDTEIQVTTPEMLEKIATSDEKIHSFKVAAVEKTIAFPLDPWHQAGDPRLLLALIFTVLGLTAQLRHNARA